MSSSTEQSEHWTVALLQAAVSQLELQAERKNRDGKQEG